MPLAIEKRIADLHSSKGRGNRTGFLADPSGARKDGFERVESKEREGTNSCKGERMRKESVWFLIFWGGSEEAGLIELSTL